eukprot:CAMPEP_0180648454 /NCGR_PEP_ID=MMETSP1037_2-20121125/50979_1 /TAXON_ID=632150 /ORGANISM="Azadinium spinosum, Strain 3D9" /LENGTH=130 /DNA_ID=CAMNT_0022673275 /DNA_START=195 /DNA_END=583 /DNA_ORIENTATION=+
MVGMLINFALWKLGPQDANCVMYKPCPGKGLLFDFTDVPHQSLFFQVVNQMWFTMELFVVLALYFPLRRAMVQRSLRYFVAQWFVSTAFFLWSVYFYSSVSEGVDAVHLLVWLAGCEAVFLAATFCIAVG